MGDGQGTEDGSGDEEGRQLEELLYDDGEEEDEQPADEGDEDASPELLEEVDVAAGSA